MKLIPKILVVFLTFFACNEVVSQDLIITENGDIFECEIQTVGPDFLTYSFTYEERTFRDTLPLTRIAYHGRNFIKQPLDKQGGEYENDLIVIKNGDVLKCKIISSKSAASIEYEFLLGDNKLRNTIEKKRVAFFAKQYRDNMNTEVYSSIYFTSLAATHPGIISVFQDAAFQRDSLLMIRDLIVKPDGEELACLIEQIDENAIHYKFLMNKAVMANTIDKSRVYYIIRDHGGELPEKILITPSARGDFTDLIITKDGTTIECSISNLGTNTVEYYIWEEGKTVYRIIRRNEIQYHGSNFLDIIDTKKEELLHSRYDDMIITKNRSVLLCNIESENVSQVEYSFEMNKQKMINFIDKADLIHFGSNFYKLQAENTLEEEEAQVLAEQNPQDFQKEKEIKKEENTEPVAVEKEVDLQAPEVIIISPELANDNTFQAVSDEMEMLKITGVVIDNGTVDQLRVNDKIIPISSQGKFTADIALNSGINSIRFGAADQSGNISEFTYTVERSKAEEKPLNVEALDTEPPKIILDQPVVDQSRHVTVENATKSVWVSGNVFDKSGVYEVLINGRDAVLSSNGNFSREVLLRVGENLVTVQASDIESNSSSEVFLIIRKDAVAQTDQPEILGFTDKYYAVIIGISDYQDPLIPNLDDHPTRDATLLSSVLSEKYVFNEENINLLINPTRVEILKTFDRLSNSIKENDNLLIFFAGHGYYDSKTNLGYWLPSDAESEFTANWIYNDVIVATLKRINSKHTLLISDACFSGSIFKTRSLNSAPVAYQKKYELRSRKAITSGVVEAVPNESIFFKVLVEKLETNPEKYMSAGELFRNMEFQISNNSPNSPQYGTIQNVNDEGGDFIFIKK